MKHLKDLRQSAAASALLMVMLFLLPLATVTPFHRGEDAPPPEDTLQEQADEPSQGADSTGQLDEATTLKVLVGDTVEQMDFGTYLMGVVRAEMPASFEQEALKAQAVAARTYTRYKLLSGGNHGDTADICTDPTCCQAYISLEKARENWGENADAYEKKVETAVLETDGQTILYGGVPILAVFHSCSAGLTRGAGEVWQSDLPYLQPVDSPEPADAIPNYYSRVAFTPQQFQEKVAAADIGADLSGPVDQWLRNAVTDSAGSVVTVDVGGVSVKGSTLRSILGLRSACFEWALEGEEIVFYVTGYGHGVGLSQYGANAMAKEGADYLAILTHYYTGVTIGPYGG